MAEDISKPVEAILWDVIDEHLDEAEFGIEQLERAFDSPTHTLTEIARDPEARLLAHIDGLVVGGRVVLAQRLVPALTDPDASAPRVAAAALALIYSGEHDHLRAALKCETTGVARAALRACELAGHAQLDAWVRDRLREERAPAALAALLDYIATRALPAPPQLLQWLQSEHPDVQRAAARAALGGDPAQHLPAIEQLLQHGEAATRDAAIVTALAWSSPHARTACERLALDQTSVQPLALQLYAALGSRDQHEQLAKQLSFTHKRRATLFALGCGGDLEHVPVLIEHLASQDPIDAKLAAQAIASIIGVDLQNEPFELAMTTTPQAGMLPTVEKDDEARAALPNLEQDDLDADLVAPPEDQLPTPNPVAIAEHWNAVRHKLDKTARYLNGAPYSLDAALAMLSASPARRRHAVATELCVRSRGRLRLHTRLFSAAQHEQIASARGQNLS